jgi:hypothetical protein
MKTFKFFAFFVVMSIVSIVAMSFTSSSTEVSSAGAELALLPDLRVSQISTPGGLCQGNLSKVRVSITNSQMAAVKVKIPVILYVSQQGQQPSSYVAYLEKGIGPNANYGQPVWFSNVTIPATGSRVTLRAVVNPDQEIQESAYNNNSKIVQARVTKVCGQTTQPPQGATLTVTAYEDGSWNFGNYQAVAGAAVTIVKNGQTYTGTTGSNGKASIANLPSGSCNITVTKPGYQTASRSYMMSSYNNNVNIAMIDQ